MEVYAADQEQIRTRLCAAEIGWKQNANVSNLTDEVLCPRRQYFISYRGSCRFSSNVRVSCVTVADIHSQYHALKNFYHHTKIFNFTSALAYCIDKTSQIASQLLKCYILWSLHTVWMLCKYFVIWWYDDMSKSIATSLVIKSNVEIKLSSNWPATFV